MRFNDEPDYILEAIIKDGHPDEVSEAHQILNERRHAAETKANNERDAQKEAIIGRGPSATPTVPAEVSSRLKRMGVTPGKMKDAADAYSNMKDAYARNPHLTEQELIEDLTARGYHPNHIQAMETMFKVLEPIVKADLGQSNVETVFPDEESRRNYLIANHFTDPEIDNTLSHWKTMNNKPGQYRIPDVAKERIAEQQIKHAEARVKRSNAQQEEQQRIGTVQDYDAQTMPGSAPEKHAMELGAAGSDILAHTYGRGYQKYKGKRFADKTIEEIESDLLTKELNPKSKEERSRQKELKDVTSRNFGKDATQKAASPYMSNASADFAKRHNELFGDIETAHEKSLYDQGRRYWEEQMAPTIKAKYLTPGVRGHGHVAKEVGEAGEKTMRGINEAIIGQRAQNRAISANATLQEQKNQAMLAGQAGALSQADASADLATVEKLEGIHARHQQERLNHAKRLGTIGESEKGEEQRKLDDARQEFRNEENHATKYAEKMIDAANRNPISGIPPEPEIPRPKQTGKHSTAAAFAGMGAGMFNKLYGETEKAAGGRIRRAIGGPVTSVAHSKYVTPHAMIGYLQAKTAHQKLATGGAVNPNFIQDAVFDGVLPSTELRQQVRRKVLNQAKDDYDAKARNHLAVGGPVGMFANAKIERASPRRIQKAPVSANPLAEGIDLAKNFADSKRDKEIQDKVHTERMKILNPTPEKEESLLSHALKGFMAGAASTGNDDWVARTGRAFTGAVSAGDAAKEAKRQREKERQKLIMDVGNQYAAERHQEKTHGLAEKGHELAKEKHSYDKLVGASTIGMNEAHQGLFEAQAKKLKSGYDMEGVPIEDQPTRPQTTQDKTALDKTALAFKALKGVATHLFPIMETSYKLDSGENLGKAQNILGSTLTSAFSSAKQEDLENMKTQSTTIVDAIQKLERDLGEGGNRTLAQAFATTVNAKPDPTKPRSENIRIIQSTFKSLDDTLSFIEQKYKSHGATPNQIAEIKLYKKELDDLRAEKEAELSKLYLPKAKEKSKEADSHNVDDAIPKNISPENQAKIAALKAQKAALLEGKG